MTSEVCCNSPIKWSFYLSSEASCSTALSSSAFKMIQFLVWYLQVLLAFSSLREKKSTPVLAKRLYETQLKQKESCRTLTARHLGQSKTTQTPHLCYQTAWYVSQETACSWKGIYCADTALQRGKSHLLSMKELHFRAYSSFKLPAIFTDF